MPAKGSHADEEHEKTEVSRLMQYTVEKQACQCKAEQGSNGDSAVSQHGSMLWATMKSLQWLLHKSLCKDFMMVHSSCHTGPKGRDSAQVLVCLVTMTPTLGHLNT